MTTNTTPQGGEVEREKFEAAWLAHIEAAPLGMDRSASALYWVDRADLFKQDDRLTYCERRTRDAWAGWQAAHASLAALPDMRSAVEELAQGFDNCMVEAVGGEIDVGEAIRTWAAQQDGIASLAALPVEGDEIPPLPPADHAYNSGSFAPLWGQLKLEAYARAAVLSDRRQRAADHSANAGKMVDGVLPADGLDGNDGFQGEHMTDILIRLKRPEGYEDVHPELILQDARIHPAFEAEIVEPAPLEGRDAVARTLVEGFLCRAWGETDLPEAALVRTADEWKAFIVEAQWGSDATYERLDADDREMVDAQVRYIVEDMDDNNGQGTIDFEIGGISVERVTFYAHPVQQEAASQDALGLPARVLAMCKARGWSLHWTHRGAYLHLESSELIEALRGKRGDPLGEAADVLLVLMSITEANGMAWSDVLAQCVRTVEKLEVAPRYEGEEFSAIAAAHLAQGGDK